MANVVLTKFWLTNTVTLDQIGAYSDPQRTRNATIDGAVRKYAGGRMRSVSALGTYGTWKVTLVELSQAQVETLESWMSVGTIIFARDHRGQSMYGTFYAVERGENVPYGFGAGIARYTAAIEISRVDVVEGI